MLSFISYCALFACGIIAACVDWNEAINELFKFENKVIVDVKIINQDTGLPTGEFEQVTYETDFDPKILLLMLAGLLTVYYVMIFVPSKVIFSYLEGK